jgi:hypothetical protein
VELAAPSVKDRKALDVKRADVERRLVVNQTQTDRLVASIKLGIDPRTLLKEQEALRTERHGLGERLKQLKDRLAALPDPEQTKRAAMLTRIRLVQEHKGKDWRKLPFEDIRRFLLHLFGETTLASGTGMFVTKDAKGKLTITFKGQVDFNSLLVGGRPITKALSAAVDKWNAYVERTFGYGKPCMAHRSWG